MYSRQDCLGSTTDKNYNDIGIRIEYTVKSVVALIVSRHNSIRKKVHLRRYSQRHFKYLNL